MKAAVSALEAADSTRVIARRRVFSPAAPVRVASSDGRLLGMLLVAGLLGYAAMGVAVYALVVALF